MTESERFDFEGANGATLSGRLERPLGSVRAVALFAHCFTCTKSSLAAVHVARALAGKGIATLRFDFTGLGGSGGEFANSGFTANVGDLIAAAAALRSAVGAPSILVGHSLGGAAVIAAAAEIPESQAVVTIGAPFDVEHVMHQIGDGLAAVGIGGQAEVEIAGRRFAISGDFVESMHGHDQAARLRRLRRALLVIHAPADQIVGIDNARRIFVAARHPKSFVSLPLKADHLLTRPGDAEYVAGLIAAWVEPYLAVAPATETLANHAVTVETLSGRFAQAVTAGRHRFVGDEPLSAGGGDLGPSPYDLLLAALGTCTSMTLNLYAARKGIEMGAVRVDLDHRRDYASDCAGCDDPKMKIDIIDRAISFSAALTEEQRQSLMAIADKCPVHKTLSSCVEIRTTEG